MSKNGLHVEKNYKINTAGEIWNIPHIQFVRRPDGQLALTKEEIDRVNNAIANVICSDEKELTWDQFDFLCKITVTKYTQISSMLKIDKSTVSKWKTGKIDYPTSVLLKQHFWEKIFAPHLKKKRADSFDAQLKSMGEKAIVEKWAERVSRAA